MEKPTNRIEALLPHYLNRESWAAGKYNQTKDEIRNGIISCGNLAGEKLVAVFQNSNYKDFRQNIILIWRDMNYTNVTPMLIQLLKDHDRFWAAQKLTNGWWKQISVQSSQTNATTFSVRSITAWLHCEHFVNHKPKKAIELTKKRREAIPARASLENPQILEECDAALKALRNQQ